MRHQALNTSVSTGVLAAAESTLPALDDLLAWPQVQPLVGNQSYTTWWRAMRRGDAPKPVQVSPNRVAWRAADIRAWQAARTPASVAA